MSDLDTGQSLNLREYLAVIRGRKWTIVIVAILATAGSLFLSYQRTPLYKTEARLLIEPLGDTFVNIQNEAQVVASVEVAQLVVQDEGLEMTTSNLLSGLEVKPLSDRSEVATVSYTSTDPVFAQLAANSFVENYLEYRRSLALAELEAERASIQRRTDSVNLDLAEIIDRIEDARRRGNLARVTTLEGERTSLSVRLGVLLQQYDNVGLGGPVRTGGGKILQRAAEPGSPVSPDHAADGILGLTLGLALGVGMAFLRERLDDRFKGRPDVERIMECPVLATVPRHTRSKKARELVIVAEPKGPASEAYRNLRTSLQFILSQRDVKSVLLTSPSEHEGKTTTTANLGMALVQAGRSVILVSSDLRRPQLEKHFDVTSDVGLSTWLLGERDDLGAILLENPSLPNLKLLPSGPIPSNPAELLTSPRLSELITRLEDHCDIMIFDSPPTLPVADAVILASRLPTVLMVLDAASTSRSAARHAKEQLERVGAEVIGCVLNAFDPTGSPYYYEPYYYSHYYAKVSGEDEASDGVTDLTVTDLRVTNTSVETRSPSGPDRG